MTSVAGASVGPVSGMTAGVVVAGPQAVRTKAAMIRVVKNIVGLFICSLLLF